MEIKYFGHSSFLIKSKEAKLVTDPFDEKMVGLSFPKTEADIVTVSHNHADHNQIGKIIGDPLIINWPGQFEKKGIRVFGFRSFHDKQKGVERGENNIYKIEVEGISIVHCGDLGIKPDDSILDEIGDVGVLMVPVGGKFTLDASEAIELIKELEPSIVIPMHYNTPKLNQINFSELAGVDEFLKKIGQESNQPVDKLVLKKEDLSDTMRVVIMNTSN